MRVLDFSRYQSSGSDSLLQEIKALRAEVVQLRADRKQADAGHATQRAALATEQLSRLDTQTTLMRNRARPGK